jgi:hypothetical protein
MATIHFLSGKELLHPSETDLWHAVLDGSSAALCGAPVLYIREDDFRGQVGRHPDCVALVIAEDAS